VHAIAAELPATATGVVAATAINFIHIVGSFRAWLVKR
jgi:ABC-type molybdate transport system permease subunit